MYHGFVRASDGTITTINAPEAGTAAGEGTFGSDINTAGAVAGYYVDANSVDHGFVRAAKDTIISFDVPGAGTNVGQGTAGFAISTAGIIAGDYADASSVYHGFVRAAKGTITSFDAPNAGTGGYQGTFPSGINTAGDIAGFYSDASNVYHGFLLAAATKTTTTLTSSPNPSTYRQVVTFTAVVSSSIGAPPDGETVSFMKGTTVLGTGTLSGGSASYMTSTLKMGTNSIEAVYGGDTNFAGSTSNVVKQVVEKAGQSQNVNSRNTLASSRCRRSSRNKNNGEVIFSAFEGPGLHFPHPRAGREVILAYVSSLDLSRVA